MRFFSGIRSGSGDKKKTSASALYKEKLLNKPKIEKTADEKYKAMIEAKMAKMMEDAIMGRKKAGMKLAGTRNNDKPKELSKNAQMMLKLLAMQKAQKDQKKERKKLREMMWAEKAKKRAENFAKAQKAAVELQKRKDEEAAATATTTPYFFGYSPEDKSGW